jgi:hypothetical protein
MFSIIFLFDFSDVSVAFAASSLVQSRTFGGLLIIT